MTICNSECANAIYTMCYNGRSIREMGYKDQEALPKDRWHFRCQLEAEHQGDHKYIRGRAGHTYTWKNYQWTNVKS